MLESLFLHASRNKNNSKSNVKSNQSNVFKPHHFKQWSGWPAPFFAADRAFVLPSPYPSSLPPIKFLPFFLSQKQKNQQRFVSSESLQPPPPQKKTAALTTFSATAYISASKDSSSFCVGRRPILSQSANQPGSSPSPRGTPTASFIPNSDILPARQLIPFRRTAPTKALSPQLNSAAR